MLYREHAPRGVHTVSNWKTVKVSTSLMEMRAAPSFDTYLRLTGTGTEIPSSVMQSSGL